MAWNPLDIFEFVFDAIEFFTTNSWSGSRSDSDKKNPGMVNKSQKQVSEESGLQKSGIDEGTKKADKAEGNKS